MRIILSTLICVLTAAWASQAQADSRQDQAMATAKAMIQELGSGLKSELQMAVKEKGFGGAVEACGKIAQTKAAQASQAHGGVIHRVSLKTRNPANEPDELEARYLKIMDEDMAKGQLKEAYFEVTGGHEGEKATLRFLKPIVTSEFCLNCHGEKSKLNPDAAARLAQEYPDDKATGYQENQVRGAFSATVLLGPK